MTAKIAEKATELHNTGALISFLRLHAPFNQMEQNELAYLIENCQIAFFPKGQLVLSEDDGIVNELYIVKKGQIVGERSSGRNGETQNTFSISAGECFPMAALLGERATRTQHRAEEDCFCFVLPRSAFANLFSRSNTFRDFAIRGVSSLLEQANKKVKTQASEAAQDGYSLDTVLGEIASNNPIVCGPDLPLRKAVKRMHEYQVGSIVATDETRKPVGIFTLRDLRKVVASGEHQFDTQLAEVMTRNPKSLPNTATAFEAALLMAEHHFAHVCLTNEAGELAGVISERDIFSLQRVNLVHLTRAIANAPSMQALISIREDISELTNNMLAHGASVVQINKIVTLLNDYTVRRVLELSIQEHNGTLPDFTWLSFGSEARMEQTLVTDQDNGIVFHTSEDNQEADRKTLIAFAKGVNQRLDQCGFTLCKGNIMASNPDLCLTQAEWINKFSRIVQTTTPENLLQSSILFDIRAIWGEEEWLEELRQHIVAKVTNNTLFQKMLAGNALLNRPPLTIFKKFITKKGPDKTKTIDLKTQGLNPFIEGIRILALANGIMTTNTLSRLEALTHIKVINKQDAAAWNEAYCFIQVLRMKLHHKQTQSGQSATNQLPIHSLNPLDERVLKESFRQAQRLQQKLELRYQL
ncbi:MAG: cyclic nucleotide-binding protein [Gammaproteobacteria bacterium]|nr:MAG: cyclic nucleotide-binding protein [Gammaproteobacteria bacterium]